MYITTEEAEIRHPGCTTVIATMYIGHIDDGVFCVVEDQWVDHPDMLPTGTLEFIGHGLGGRVWYEDGKWLYSDFGDVCCSAHRPDGPDHGVYEYIGTGQERS